MSNERYRLRVTEKSFAQAFGLGNGHGSVVKLLCPFAGHTLTHEFLLNLQRHRMAAAELPRGLAEVECSGLVYHVPSHDAHVINLYRFVSADSFKARAMGKRRMSARSAGRPHGTAGNRQIGAGHDVAVEYHLVEAPNPHQSLMARSPVESLEQAGKLQFGHALPRARPGQT